MPAVTTEQFVVPHVFFVTFKPGISFSAVCLLFAVKSGIFFRGSFSCQSFTLMGTHLLQSGIFISSSFSCQAVLISSIIWQSVQRVCSYLSPPLSHPFLLLLVCLCRCRSFPPLIGSLDLPPSVFSLSTQLLALAIHRGIHFVHRF